MDVDNLVEHFNRECHGNGFDCDWQGRTNPDGQIKLWGGFHAMNADGYYDGWANFVVVVQPGTREFRLDWDEEDSQHVAEEHDLRDYIEESVAYTLKKFTE